MNVFNVLKALCNATALQTDVGLLRAAMRLILLL
jgi:hypothetical protein